MTVSIGIRREDKNEWERRTPLVPDDVRELREHGVQVWVQPSPIRAFHADDYERAGAVVQEDLVGCPVVFAIKEIPPHLFRPGQTYVFFAHVIKGQEHNMPMLKRLLDLGCTLIEYEKIVDEKGRRVVFFGNYAGLAGMMDALWALGQRLAWEGIANPFQAMHLAHDYPNLDEAKSAVAALGQRIAREGLPDSLAPLVIGVAGYGNVAKGVQDILSLLPREDVAPADLPSLTPARDRVYTVTVKEEHSVEPIAPGQPFELQDYYQHPEKYRGRFASYLPYLTVLMNAIYWDKKYPRLVTKADLRTLYSGPTPPRLRVIGDISCDIEGGIEATVHCTDAGHPVFVYDPVNGQAVDGWAGHGPVILAIDNLPGELPRESSTTFSHTLKPLVAAIAQADYTVSFEVLELPPLIKNAVIAYRGALTPNYQYLERFL
jgi:alpha-aminoadipic semialdehyde synthase